MRDQFSRRVDVEETVACNLIPMIDIMFLLLLFFMLSADMTTRVAEDIKIPRADMIKEDLVAERIAIASYGEMIRYIGENDPTTRVMLEGILATEEEHAEDLSSLLATKELGAFLKP